jgi:hypothetical protein
LGGEETEATYGMEGSLVDLGEGGNVREKDKKGYQSGSI